MASWMVRLSKGARPLLERFGQPRRASSHISTMVGSTVKTGPSKPSVHGLKPFNGASGRDLELLSSGGAPFWWGGTAILQGALDDAPQ